MEYVLSKKLIIISILIIQVLLIYFLIINFGNYILIDESQTCGYKSISGYNCSSCGNTRSVISFFKGYFGKSYSFNYVGFFVSLCFCLDGLIGIVSIFYKRMVRIRIKLVLIEIVFILLLSSFRWVHLNYF